MRLIHGRAFAKPLKGGRLLLCLQCETGTVSRDGIAGAGPAEGSGGLISGNYWDTLRVGLFEKLRRPQ